MIWNIMAVVSIAIGAGTGLLVATWLSRKEEDAPTPFGPKDIKDFLSIPSGSISWDEWLDMPDLCKAAFITAAEDIERARLLVIVTALCGPTQAKRAKDALVGNDIRCLNALIRAADKIEAAEMPIYQSGAG